MKQIRPAAQVLSAVEQVLSAKHPAESQEPPLEHVANLLMAGRGYRQIAFSLAARRVSEQVSRGAQLSPAGTELAVPIKLAGRFFGWMYVASGRANGFGLVDRALLKDVAAGVARFLTGKGRYMLRKAREMAPPEAPAKPRRAAAGEKNPR